MKIQEAMSSDPITCRVSDTISSVAGIMRKSRVGGIPVMDGSKIAGMVTETDILRLLMTKGPSDDLWLPSPLEFIELPIRELISWEHTREALTDIGSRPISEIMSQPVITIGPDEDVEDAARLMLDKKINRLCVVRNGSLIGIVTRQDIVWGVAGGTAGE